MNLVRSAGVIAAGEGSRFKQAGIHTHKPLIPVAGVPLIGHTLNYFQTLGIQRVVIIFNEQEQECVEWVLEHYPKLQCEFIIKTTTSSFESFWRVGQKLGEGRHLISTVDSFCKPEELKKIAIAEDSGKIYLGVTAFVDDEKPCWVKMDDLQRIVELGGKTGSHATAGFYNVTGGLFEQDIPEGMTALRVFLKRLVDQNYAVHGVELANVVDIDSPKDIFQAEKQINF